MRIGLLAGPGSLLPQPQLQLTNELADPSNQVIDLLWDHHETRLYEQIRHGNHDVLLIVACLRQRDNDPAHEQREEDCIRIASLIRRLNPLPENKPRIILASSYSSLELTAIEPDLNLVPLICLQNTGSLREELGRGRTRSFAAPVFTQANGLQHVLSGV